MTDIFSKNPTEDEIKYCTVVFNYEEVLDNLE